MDRKVLVQLALALLGFLLIYVGVTYDMGPLAWIGGPLVFASLYWYYHTLSKKAEKEGVKVIRPM